MQRIIFVIALLNASAASFAAENPLVAPSDVKAKYIILEIGGEWPNRTIVTKRVGSIVTSYSKRIYNCSNKTFKYVSSGDTLADKAWSKPDQNMTSIVPRSIADYAGRPACKR